VGLWTSRQQAQGSHQNRWPRPKWPCLRFMGLPSAAGRRPVLGAGKVPAACCLVTRRSYRRASCMGRTAPNVSPFRGRSRLPATFVTCRYLREKYGNMERVGAKVVNTAATASIAAAILGAQPAGNLFCIHLRERAADLSVSAKDRLTDQRRRDDAPVEDNGERAPHVLLGEPR
jgi:hypothetical protein